MAKHFYLVLCPQPTATGILGPACKVSFEPDSDPPISRPARARLAEDKSCPPTTPHLAPEKEWRGTSPSLEFQIIWTSKLTNKPGTKRLERSLYTCTE